MGHLTSLFAGTFTTLLAIINPLEALPIFLKLLEGQGRDAHLQVARRSCFYATGLLVFFLVFGNLVLRIFEVPLSMVRMVGGIVLMRIGFALFMPSGTGRWCPVVAAGHSQQPMLPSCEHMTSGRRARFASAQELFSVLAKMLAELGEKGS